MTNSYPGRFAITGIATRAITVAKHVLGGALLLTAGVANAQIQTTSCPPLNAGQWRMVGLPHNPDTVNTVVDQFGDDLTGTIDVEWLAFERNETTDSYDRLGATSTLNQTSGYWLWSLNADPYDITGIPTTTTGPAQPNCADQTQGCFEIPLVGPAAQGGTLFNLVGNPFDNAIPWQDVRFVTTTGAALRPSEAESNAPSLAAKTLWKYNGASYDVFDDITPGVIGELLPCDGFWVKVTDPNVVMLTIPGAPVDDAPVGVDDTQTVTEDDAATTIDVQANDTDVDATVANVISTVTQPTNGSVVITSAGADLTYEPNANYCNDGAATDDFTYTLSPGGGTATVAVTVTCVNDDPTITGGATASVSIAENQTAVTDVQSTDADDAEGAGLTYSLSGGDDQTFFSVDSNTGVLTFNAAPDFENPGDAGGNNVYEVQVTVADSGALTDVQDIAVTITDVDSADLSITTLDSADPVVAGSLLVYTITVSNAGPEPSALVGVADILPAGVTFVSTSGCVESPAAGVPGCSLAASIASGASAQYTVTVMVNAGTTGIITNNVMVLSPSNDPNSGTNTAAENTRGIAPPAPLVENNMNTATGNIGFIIETFGPTGTETSAGGTGASVNGGVVSLNVDGSFSYDPPAGFIGVDTFAYTFTSRIGRIGDIDTATVSITVSQTGWVINESGGVR